MGMMGYQDPMLTQYGLGAQGNGNTNRLTTGGSPSGGGTPTGLSGGSGNQMDQLLMQYLYELKKPLNMEDPYVKQYVQMMTASASKQARLQGVEGPLSILNSQHAGMNALGQLEMQRRNMYPGALQMGLGRDQWIQNQQLEGMLRQYQSGLDTAQGIGGLLGGVAGGALGFAAGGPALMVPAAGMGASLGAGTGGMFAGPPPNPYGGYRGGL